MHAVTIDAPRAARADDAVVRSGRRGAPRRRLRVPPVPHEEPGGRRRPPRARPSRLHSEVASLRPGPRDTARMAARDRTLDRPRLVPRRRATPQARGACRGCGAARRVGLVRRGLLARARREASRPFRAGEREVVALRIVLDLDGEEAARLLGISPTAVSTRLSRALSKLEERMRDHDVAPELIHELRASRPSAPAELRARVRVMRGRAARPRALGRAGGSGPTRDASLPSRPAAALAHRERRSARARALRRRPRGLPPASARQGNGGERRREQPDRRASHRLRGERRAPRSTSRPIARSASAQR